MAPFARRALLVLATSLAALYPSTPGADRADVRDFIADLLAEGWMQARWRGLVTSLRCAAGDLLRAWSGRAALPVSAPGAPVRREARRTSWVGDRALVEARDAVRGLTRARAYAAATIVALTIGIAGTTTSFTLINGSIWAPLPYPDRDRIVLINEQDHDGNYMSIAYPNFVDWRARQQVFDEIGIYFGGTIGVAGGEGPPARLEAAMMSASVFTSLGTVPLAGRLFDERHDRSNLREVVIGEKLWRTRFGGRASIVGEPGAIMIDDDPFTIVGIAPASTRFPSRLNTIWLPLGPALSALPMTRDQHPGFNAIARLRRGVSIEDARADLHTITADLGRRYPSTNADRDVVIEPLIDAVIAVARPAFRALLGGSGLLLLVALINVGGLAVARTIERQRHRAIHTALGSSPGRDLGRTCLEAAVIGGVAGGCGLLLSWIAVYVFTSSSLTSIPRFDLIAIDARSVAVAGALTLGAIALLIIAAQARVRPARSAWRGGIIAMQTAVAMVLVIGAGLLLRSFAALTWTDLGFTPSHVTTMKVLPPQPRYSADALVDFHLRLLARLQRLPGVEAVGVNSTIPLEGRGTEAPLTTDALDAVGQHRRLPRALYQTTGGDYFAAMKIDVIAGRAFDVRDQHGPLVAIVDEQLAATVFDGQAVGRRLAFEYAGAEGTPIWRDIVGVVRRVKHYVINDDKPFGQIYTPLTQMPNYLRRQRSSVAFVIRSPRSPDDLLAATRAEIAALDPTLPVFSVVTMSGYVSRQIEQPRLRAAVVGIFAAIALALAAFGLYAVLSYHATRRMREMGVRLTLGARPSDIAWLLLRDGAIAGLIGAAIGLAIAFVAAPLLTNLIIVPPRDPATFATAAIVLSAVVLLASLQPARRAAAVDPRTVLEP